MKKVLFLLVFQFLIFWANAALVGKIEPQFWWTGMKQQSLELLVYGNNLKGTQVSISKGDTRISSVEDADNPDYLFVTLEIRPKQQPGKLELTFTKGAEKQVVSYDLYERKSNSALRKGFDQSDVIYLIMSDRFSNGDPSNDNTTDTQEKSDRNNPNTRHGGDISGIVSRLDYLKELGITAVWPTPLLTSDQSKNSYHGYACTDFYSVDPRYGSNKLYRQLAIECHNRGLKLIMDMVPNHCGISHLWVKNPPTKDWIHPVPESSSRTLSIPVWTDPHASEIDCHQNKDGWFSPLMPDLNQNNEKVLRYFTQNSIWWIEYAGLDGLRVDTYPYCEKSKIAEWTQSIMDEYPNLNIVGEVWQPQSSSVAYWQKDANNQDHFNSHLPCVMDFPLMDAMVEAFNASENNRGNAVHNLYAVLAQDYLYPNPNNIMTFAENHDTERFSTLIGKDQNLYQAAFAFLLTIRGIPQIYYGSEIMMNSDKEGIYTNNANRKEMPGGWAEDSRNVFSHDGRLPIENEMHDYFSKLLNWRKHTPVVQTGMLKHFKPKDGVYTYFRYNNAGECVMVMLNTSNEAKEVDTQRFREIMGNYQSGVEVISGERTENLKSISIKPKSACILELKRN
jgi:glycosidase